jgi:integrase
MAWAETRDGKLTGRWLGRVRIEREGRALKFGPRAFDTKAAAELYETLTRATGQEPPQFASSEPEDAKTFAQVAKECKELGGPKRKGGARKWKAQRDPSVIQRVTTIAQLDWFGSKPIATVDEASLEELREKLAVRPGYHGGTLSAATLNRYMAAASAVLTFAMQQKYIGIKPQVPIYDEDNEKIVWLDENQETAICNALLSQGWDHEKLGVRVLIETGIRWGEFETLEPGQVDDGWIRLWKTKTNRPRSAPISPETARSLRALLASGFQYKYCTFRDRFYAARDLCGQSSEITIHKLRHTTATRMVASGTDIRIVQKYLGHTRLSTTERYAHVFDNMLHEAHKKVFGSVGNGAQVAPEGPAQVVEFQRVGGHARN